MHKQLEQEILSRIQILARNCTIYREIQQNTVIVIIVAPSRNLARQLSILQELPQEIHQLGMGSAYQLKYRIGAMQKDFMSPRFVLHHL